MRRLAFLLALLITGCGVWKPDARFADDVETKAILAAVSRTPVVSDEQVTCVADKLTPPLQHRRDIDDDPVVRAGNLQHPPWQRANREIGKKPVWLPAEQGRELETLYLKAFDATKDAHKSIAARPFLSPDMVILADAGSPRCSKDGVWTQVYSRPVVVRDIAFVDVGTHCGGPGLCGWGEIRALRKQGNGWDEVAVQPTYME